MYVMYVIVPIMHLFVILNERFTNRAIAHAVRLLVQIGVCHGAIDNSRLRLAYAPHARNFDEIGRRRNSGTLGRRKDAVS